MAGVTARRGFYGQALRTFAQELSMADWARIWTETQTGAGFAPYVAADAGAGAIPAATAAGGLEAEGIGAKPAGLSTLIRK